MSFLRSVSMVVLASAVIFASTGCETSADATSSAPAASGDGLDTQQTQTYGTVTMNAGAPEIDTVNGLVRATMSWTGSGSATTGACLLLRVEDGPYPTSTNNCGEITDYSTQPVPCTDDSKCAPYATAYTGGSGHCRAPDNSGQKYCYVRPGPRSTYCVGTPANGQAVSVPSTLTTGWVSAARGYGQWSTFYMDCRESYGGDSGYFDTWMLDGCMNGCSGSTTTPSDSTESQYWYR